MRQFPKNKFEAASGETRPWVGIGLLVISALGFTANIVIINMAFKDGLDVNTANAVRYFVAIVLLFFFVKHRGKRLKLPPRQRYTALCLGVLIFMVGFGYLGATRYLPVSMAVLIFYTAPFFVAVISRFTEKEPLTLMRVLAIVTAFVGLALVLKIHSVAALNFKGVAFAFLAAAGAASLVTISSLTMRRSDPQVVNLHCLAVGAALFAALLLFSGGPPGSITVPGWLKVWASGVTLAVGYIAFFAGLRIVGPLKTSMLLNLEPISTILLAALLLGERLSSMQLLGGGLVIIGIILITITGGVKNANRFKS
jgi:drug/metabolite transporter (DMT)-like permease